MSRTLLSFKLTRYCWTTDSMSKYSHCGCHVPPATLLTTGCANVAAGDMPFRSTERGAVHVESRFCPQFCCPKQLESWITKVILPPPRTGKLALNFITNVSWRPS